MKMRTRILLVRLLAVGLVLGAACASILAAPISLQEFQARLAPHGQWFVSARYGNVWQPSLARPGWNPYYDGHWEYTDVGQTWVSDYAWGALPYHYGTWALEPGRGWVWIPGDTWAPSWVVFRTGSDYIGWAPVAPGFVVGGALSAPEVEGPAFIFVPARQFFAPRVRACAVPASRATVILKKTTIVLNTIRIENQIVVNRGPSLAELQRATGKPVRTAQLESARCLAPGMGRREIRVDAARDRSGVRAVAPSMARAPMSAKAAPDGARDRGAARTAYDRTGSDDRDARAGRDDRGDHDGRIDEPAGPARPTRVAHQDVYDRNSDVRATRAPAADTRANLSGDTQSDRDVRLLVSREKTERGRTRSADRAKPPKTRSRS